jgi:hypothetical protein
MRQSVFIAKGVVISSIAAGPIFVTALGGAALYATLPKAIPIGPAVFDFAAISALLGMGLLVLMFGFVLALLPNALGGGVLGTLGLRSEIARIPVIWALVGIGLAAIPVALFPELRIEEAPIGAALIITSALCALIVRRHTKWVVDADEPITRAPASLSPPEQSALGHRNTGSRLLD